MKQATSGCFVSPKQWEGHKCHFYLCSYQPWTRGHRLPFLVPVTTASFRNLGPPLTIVLSFRKYGSLLTPSIHWVSCVRLPRPVFIFFAFCLYPPYRIFLTSTKPYKGEDGTISTIGRRWRMHLYLCSNIPHPLWKILPGLTVTCLLA